jgi:hypothetical protein
VNEEALLVVLSDLGWVVPCKYEFRVNRGVLGSGHVDFDSDRSRCQTVGM